MKKKKPRETADTGFFAQARPAEKKSLLSMLISAGLGVLTVLVSLFPLWIKTPENKNVLYNFLGVVNQDVGSDAVRDDNVPLLLFYYAGVVLLAVGCIGVYNKLKIAPVFLVFAAVSLLCFAGKQHGDRGVFRHTDSRHHDFSGGQHADCLGAVGGICFEANAATRQETITPRGYHNNPMQP